MIQSLNRKFFILLSNNKWIEQGAKSWGLKLGASKVVAGMDIESAVNIIQNLNDSGRKVTLDHLGEFVYKADEAIRAFEDSMHTLDMIHQNALSSTLSVKLTKLGLDVDKNLCWKQISELAQHAASYNNKINIDMEDYVHYKDVLDIVEQLHHEYGNVSTVLQSYLHCGLEDVKRLKNIPLRIVKGAYKEDASVAYQDKKMIDENYMEMVRQNLLYGTFTSIATHDHHIINEIKEFVERNGIDKSQFEFQMLYGFRNDVQLSLVKEGYQFRTYVPFGNEWYGYYMRRLAERPQNVLFAIRGMLSK